MLSTFSLGSWAERTVAIAEHWLEVATLPESLLLLELLNSPLTRQTQPMEVLGHMLGICVVIQDKGFPQLLFCNAGEPFSRTGRQAFVTPLPHGDAVTFLFFPFSLFPSGFLPVCVEKSLGLEGRWS